jgi:P-type Mg2+ transporter
MAEFDFVSSPIENVFVRLGTSPNGLSDKEVKKQRLIYGYNEPAKSKRISVLGHLLLKFLNPLVVVLLIIAGFSWFFGEKISTLIVTLMAVISVLLSFIQEYRAGREAEHLSEMVHAKATVYRHGKVRELLIREIVPGDIVDLYAGDVIPADLRIISCKDLFVNQASLTGESFPAEKSPGEIKNLTTSVTDLNNICFMGSAVVSGTGLAVVIRTGRNTQFGELAYKLSAANMATSFDKGIRDFTWLMIKAMLGMVLVIFAINAARRGDLIQSLLFSLGVAVGLTPEMLPMLVTVNLSKGAIAMSKKDVIVKRLNSIQNFGAMDVLCTDKTGTLTLNQIVLEKHCDVLGKEEEDVLLFAYINSSYQTGLKNLLDVTILKHEKFAIRRFTKIDEIPFDFERKIMSVAVEMDGHHRLISKGAPEEIFKKCTHYYVDGKIHEMHHGLHAGLKKEFDDLSREGYRVLAVAYKDEPTSKKIFSKEDEKEMILKGYVAFLDPPKPSVKNAIQALKKLGITIKVLTGDTELVTEKICREVGLDVAGLINGDKLDTLNDTQLKEHLNTTTVFARLSPFQKERVIRALHNAGRTVGYLGDGINDAPALKSSDVGISVNNAVDIAKDSADLILLKKSLMVLKDGVIEGRKTFGNIIKYIKMGSSSNFGNMLSMTGGSLFLPFLPMLPIQILLNNFLYDISQLAISTDEVDKDYLTRPRPWNIKSIMNFMVIIGPLSSIFDFITFAVMLLIFRSSAELFHTGWFIESLCTQTLVIYVIRTGKIPFIQSMPSKWLMISSILIVLTGIMLPFSPLAAPFGFVVPPPSFFMILLLMIISYLLLVQAVKSWLVRRYGFD